MSRADAARLRNECRRKAVHLTTGLVPLAYAAGLSRPWTLAIFGVCSAVMVGVELLRRGPSWVGRLFRHWFAFMLRPRELDGDKLLGATPYCLVSLACVALLPKPLAVLALLYLAIGDTAASIVGLTWGRIAIGDKTVEGFLAFWATTSLVAVAAHAASPDYPLVAALVASPVAGAAELLLRRWDDNWVVPVVAGATLLLLVNL